MLAQLEYCGFNHLEMETEKSSEDKGPATVVFEVVVADNP